MTHQISKTQNSVQSPVFSVFDIIQNQHIKLIIDNIIKTYLLQTHEDEESMKN
jgi:hypothetical protein